nr:hypothetical protein [Tanacetum cinerariifolium]
MVTTIEQQVALDEALVPSAQRYKMDIKKHIVDLESFREMLHISPRVLGQSFAELPFEEEILEFLRFLGHSAQIKTLTNVNVNKLYHLWRSFTAVINKFLNGKSTSFDSLRVSWHYVRDDILFSTIKVVSRHQNTQQYGAILPIELTTEDIRNTKVYACATEEAAPKPKASARKKKEAAQLKIVLRRSRHETHISQQGGFGTDEGADVDDQTKGSDDNEGEKTDESDDDDDDDQDEAEKVNDDDDDEEEISKIGEQEAIESDEGDEEATESDRESEDEKTREQEEESFDPIPQTPEDSEDDDNNKEDQGLRIGEEERMHEEEEADELYRDVDINQGRGLQVSQVIEDSHVTLTPTHSYGQQKSSSTSSFMTNLLNPTIDPGMESIFTTGSSTVTPIHSPQFTMTPSIISTFTTASQLPIPLTPIPSLDLQNLPTFASVFHFEDRVQSLEVNFSKIPGIVHQYMHQQMPEAVREAVQTQTDRLQDFIQKENDEFLKTIDNNMKKIIKEQVRTQVKAQVTRIMPRIEESVNALLEAEVLTRSSHSSRTSYAVAADLLEMELKKILIEKMEGNKREDDDQEGPSTGLDQGSKRRREGGEHASANTPSEPATGSADRSTTGTQSRQLSANYRGRRVILFEHFINNDLEYLRGGASSRKYTTSVTKTKAADYGHIKWIEDLVPRAMWIQEPINYDKHALWGVSYWGQKRQQFYGFAVNRESALDVYSKRRIIAVTDLKIVEWHNYKHLDWISVRRDDDKIYKFKEGDFKRLRLKDIEDMLLLLVQGKLSNLTVEERFAFNVSLRMFTRSIVIQRRVEDLDLKRREAYTAHSNLRGFIYQNKDKKNRLMQIDELHKFNDGTLNDVRNALDDRLKGIRMQYLPTTIWRKGDKDRAAAMIQAIDKMLKTRRIMRSLERFVGGRQYEGDFRMLQRTI